MTGKTVDAAKEAALDQLGVAEGDAELIVVSEPRAGLFGRMRGEARVRARVRPVGPRPKRQRRAGRDRNRSGGGGGGRGGSGGGRGGRADADEGTAGGGDGSRSRGGSGGVAAEQGQSRQAGEGAGKSRSARRRRSRSRARLGGAEPGGASAAAAGSGDGAAPAGAGEGDVGRGRRDDNGRRPQTKEEPEMVEGVTLEEQAAVAKEFLEGLMERYGFDASVEARVLDEETVELAADGEGLGVLVGPKGTTLAALQDVTRTVVQRRFPNRTDRILVDVAGYRERRVAALHRFSEQVAAEVLESGTERALEAMSPADRKVVHDTVNEIDGVVTRSEGEDPDRYIVIAPAG